MQPNERRRPVENVVLVPCPVCGIDLLPQKRYSSPFETHILASQISVDFEPKEKITVRCPTCRRDYSEYVAQIMTNYALLGRLLFGPTDVYSDVRSAMAQIRYEIDHLPDSPEATSYQTILDRHFGLQDGTTHTYSSVAVYLHQKRVYVQKLVGLAVKLLKTRESFARLKTTRYQSPTQIHDILTFAHEALTKIAERNKQNKDNQVSG